jgi:hypothetical protein
MTDTFEHNPGDHEDPLAGPTWTISFIGVALLAVSMLGVAALFYDVEGIERDVKVLAVPVEEVATMRAAQEARLAGPVRLERRIEGEDSLVIPIEQAMEAVVSEGFE